MEQSKAAPEFDEWYAANWGRLVGAMTLATGSRDVAEDIAGEAFERAFARWSSLTEKGDPTSWLFTVAWNEVRSDWRRGMTHSRLVERLAAAPSSTTPPEPPIPNHELWTAIAELPDRARQAMGLRYVADLTEAQVAEVMGVTRGTVASTLSDARRRLATKLAEFTIEPSSDSEAAL